TGVKGNIHILANTTAITEILPPALGAFLAAHPQVDIRLEERLSPEIARAVAEGLADVGILAGTVQTPGLAVLPYRSDRLVLAVADTRRLAGRGRVAFAEVLEENFVSLRRDSAIHSFSTKIAASMGARLKIRIEVSGFEALCRTVEAEVGVGLLPDSVAARL